jgi:stage V sporulation protein G
MTITDIKIVLADEVKVKAYVSIVLNDAIAIKGIKVIDTDQGLMVGMPSRKTKMGTYKDVVHPVTSEAREQLVDPILCAYTMALAGMRVDGSL